MPGTPRRFAGGLSVEVGNFSISRTRSCSRRFRFVSQTDANGRVTYLAYDPVSRLTSQTDPLGGIASFAYSAAGQTATVTDPGGNATGGIVYDDVGNLSSMPLGNGVVQDHSYDGANRLTSAVVCQGTWYLRF